MRNSTWWLVMVGLVIGGAARAEGSDCAKIYSKVSEHYSYTLGSGQNEKQSGEYLAGAAALMIIPCAAISKSPGLCAAIFGAAGLVGGGVALDGSHRVDAIEISSEADASRIYELYLAAKTAVFAPNTPADPDYEKQIGASLDSLGIATTSDARYTSLQKLAMGIDSGAFCADGKTLSMEELKAKF